VINVVAYIDRSFPVFDVIVGGAMCKNIYL
jgi:hypothetical protein